MPRIEFPFCDICGETFPGEIDGGFQCPNCTGLSFYFEFARAAMDRCEDTLELIHRLKYGREIHLAPELGRLAAEAFSDRRLEIAMEEKWPLIPVPLHRARQRERQFNQAEEIARGIAALTGLEVATHLSRVRSTQTQTRLSRNQRMENLKGAFSQRLPGFFSTKSNSLPLAELPGIILIDDVFTTGSTVDSCAKVLKKAGVKRVAVVTVMRG